MNKLEEDANGLNGTDMHPVPQIRMEQQESALDKEVFAGMQKESVFSGKFPAVSSSQVLSSEYVTSGGGIPGKIKKKKSYVCDICDKVFNRSDNLKIHKRVHTNEKPYMCVVCHKQFSRSQHLTTHMRSHTGEKPFHCEVCNKRFSESKSLKNHRLIHTGERPAECDLCGKCFTHSGHLKRHVMTHTTEKPFKCGLCDKAYTRSENLEKHMKLHTLGKVYNCTVCDKTFLSIELFQLHMKWHAGGRVAQCEVCDKIFIRKDYLRKHIKAMHTNQLGFQCQYCNKQFRQMTSFSTHMLTHKQESSYSSIMCKNTLSNASEVKHPAKVVKSAAMTDF